MFDLLRKLKFGARVYLSRKGGEPETIAVRSRSIELRHAGDGPPLVYLHSTLGESFQWFPFYQTLAQDFTVYVPTHPGFGKSTGLDEIATIEDMAFHYLELFDALGLEQVILGGVSLGGWIAAEFAARWPERVKKLWIAAAPGLWVEDQPLPDMYRYLEDRDKMRSLLFHDPTGYMATLVIADKQDEERMLAAYQGLSVLARLMWQRPYSPKLPARLYRIQCPTLLLWGANDRLVPPAYGEAYHKLIPHAQWQTIPDCGHLLMFEKEAEFVHAVRDFGKRK